LPKELKTALHPWQQNSWPFVIIGGMGVGSPQSSHSITPTKDKL